MGFLEEASYVLGLAGGLNVLTTQLGFNIVEKFLPTYAKPAYYVIGIAAGYALYLRYGKKG